MEKKENQIENIIIEYNNLILVAVCDIKRNVVPDIELDSEDEFFIEFS